jgi:DNA-binding NarL/FixJ family response regulator
LELGLGVWQGAYQGIEGKWLRWYEASGDWIPTEVEGRQLAETQAETERSARELAETQAETERSARELAETQAETERSARHLAETQAETERSARRSAIPRLASLGLTVEQIAESLGLSIAEVQAQIYS